MFSNKKYALLLLYVVCNFILPLHAKKFAFCVVAVADLTGQPMQSIFPHQTPEKSYANISASPGTCTKATALIACQRTRQLLLHEVVEIVKEHGSEVCIKILNAFYHNSSTQKPCRLYWTLKRNLFSFEELEKRVEHRNYLPEAISYKKDNTTSLHNTKNVVTLKLPFFDIITQKTYSAGTRFVIDWYHHISQTYFVYVFDTESLEFITIHIPAYFCIEYQHIHQNDRKNMFVDLLVLWTNNRAGATPFVWGGCSMIDAYQDNSFKEQTATANAHESVTFYTRQKHENRTYTGFDASGLILRAAQICNIPYYYANTSTALAHLETITDITELQNGDLLWVPGGMAIISDLEKSLLIAARGYSAGYGIINELPIEKLFKNILTFSDLMDALKTNKPLEYCNAKGIVTTTYTTGKFLRLPLS